MTSSVSDTDAPSTDSPGVGVPAIAQRLATLAHATSVENLPAAQAASVPQRVLDVLGICVCATQLDTSAAVAAFVAQQGGSPRSTGIGVGDRMPQASAALLNGTLAHSLDYDDTHLPSILHPSASVVPAALAAAQAHECTGADLVAAIAVGLEVAVRVGMAGFDRETGANIWFDRGQHATSICGAIGSAVAAGRLAGLDETGLADAMAVAASMSSGIIEANRTGGTVKRIHCGWAAHSGVTAAELTVRGLTGPPMVFEGRFGLLQAFLGDRAKPDEILDGFSEDPAANHWRVADIFYKPYPANHYTHCGIDAAIQLREQGLRPDDVATAELGVATATVRTIGEPLVTKQNPRSGYQAQFSGPYTVAAALLGGSGLGLGLDDFADLQVGEPAVVELMSKVTVVGDPVCDAIYPHQFPAVLTVTTRTGERLRCEVMENRGGPRRPLGDEHLAAKFADNVEGLLTSADRDLVVEVVGNLAAAASLHPLMDVIAGVERTSRDLPHAT